MDADDLGRMLGWEFSLMVTTVRLINSGLLDELPTLKISGRAFCRRHRSIPPTHSRVSAERGNWHGVNSAA